MSRAAVSAQGIGCRRGGRTVLSGVDLLVPAGTRLAVVGPNGAGKTTLLRVLSGLDVPACGTVRVDGEDLTRMPARRRAQTIAVVGQEERPSGELTVAEAVALGRTPYRNPWSRAVAEERHIVDDALTAVGLHGWGDRSSAQLSGGERHRVVLARALAQRTAVLVLDEPTNHLDAAWRLRFMKILDDLACTVVAAMHDLDLVLRHFDAVAVVDDGTLVAHGPPAQVLDSALLWEVFDVAGDVIAHPTTGRCHLLLTHADPAFNRFRGI
ncbi:ABC transporter ATP-binding protein [Mycolicibacterium holsaticum]|jgi:iron complex transport system ATP-binding protein|uniref:Molybdate ABC transporter substrate-binding protein n=1 Tax=Mycolicibacterium holsaticum TaxID=152142 RepID=A0A1E3RUJ1_9MYCO|nr:ABC transporter ATP-binding protein [Mycolicibacterium holsaticum]MDA4107795.1 molybdate ABC transporter substrate-binding protein [Mycolicibacterium holsaticum DSM 44478 = JCM 12374]ODQ93586.1 molybdate ABC transporter substrate-binding protein [Mycolicibacterium holsaticum]QZA14759.1 ABC transporter ATP-binding protein [Mycolicibacterium holsaticum DSM 44478 = JCM 12374]UNC07798.1 ABC transporter ATP-binding protein [Mycolicibacterium holsaticum DSM 44478 = JCM 12374]